MIEIDWIIWNRGLMFYLYKKKHKVEKALGAILNHSRTYLKEVFGKPLQFITIAEVKHYVVVWQQKQTEPKVWDTWYKNVYFLPDVNDYSTSVNKDPNIRVACVYSLRKMLIPS